MPLKKRKWDISWRCSTKYTGLTQVMCACVHILVATIRVLVLYRVLSEMSHQRFVQESDKLGKGVTITLVVWATADALFACGLLFSTDEKRLLNHRNHCFWIVTVWLIWTGHGILFYTWVAIKITDIDETNAIWPLIQITMFCIVTPYGCELRVPNLVHSETEEDSHSQLTAEFRKGGKKRRRSLSSVNTTTSTDASRRSVALDPEARIQWLEDGDEGMPMPKRRSLPPDAALQMRRGSDATYPGRMFPPDAALPRRSLPPGDPLLPQRNYPPDALLPRRSLPLDSGIPLLPRRMSLGSAPARISQDDDDVNMTISSGKGLIQVPAYVTSTTRTLVKKGNKKKRRSKSRDESKFGSSE